VLSFIAFEVKFLMEDSLVTAVVPVIPLYSGGSSWVQFM